MNSIQEGDLLRSRVGQASHGDQQFNGFRHDCQAPASQGLGIRDVTLQLSPGLFEMLQRGQSVPNNESMACTKPITASSMPEDLLANPELPSLLTLHPDELSGQKESTTKAAARWKKGHVAVAANRLFKAAMAPKPEESELASPVPEVPKKRRKPKKVLLVVLEPAVRALFRRSFSVFWMHWWDCMNTQLQLLACCRGHRSYNIYLS